MRQEPLQPLSLQRWRGRWRPFLLIAFLAPGIPDASEGESALQEMVLAPGFASRVYAEEPRFANPVGFTFDDQGRCYVVETYRRRTSAFDIRFFPDWLEEDLALRSVEDRRRLLEARVVDGSPSIASRFRVDRNRDGVFDYRDLAVESERIRLLADEDGDGLADSAATFAEGFDSTVSGLAGGALAWGDSLWFACIPDLWRLRDRDQDGRAEEREPLHSGFGVHLGLGGHDLNGPVLGPDRRLYFAVGDRGARVEREGEVLADLPDTGAVFRCKLDGSDLEVVATGLRNPHDLAFDHLGNLWTVDNNAGSGDRCRLIHVVEGADYGWRIGWQWFSGKGLWEREGIWKLPEENTGAWVLPPVAHVGHGPSGLACYPGTGLSDRFAGHFFLADFPGGIRYFRPEPEGAGFALPHPPEQLQGGSAGSMEHRILWGLYPVDVGFGPGGGIYVADWVEGWEKTGKGRIFHLVEEGITAFGESTATDRILAEGMEGRSSKEVAGFLGHPDARVRMRAQFELVDRHDRSGNSLEEAIAGALGLSPFALLQEALEAGPTLEARLHGLWGLGEILADTASGSRFLAPFLEDPDPEVRAQTARTLADRGLVGFHSNYLALLQDPDPRVRFHGMLWAGKTVRRGFHEVQARDGLPELVSLRDSSLFLDQLRQNDDRDAWLRHAAVMALAWIGDVPALVQAASLESRSARLGAVLALRRLGRPEIGAYLEDADPGIVQEAARAIHDLDFAQAMPDLAALHARLDLPMPVLERSLNALFRLGRDQDAAILVDFAMKAEVPEPLRLAALRALGHWADPPSVDPLLGLWRPAAERDARAAVVPLDQALAALLEDPSESVRVAAIEAMAKLGMAREEGRLEALVRDPDAGEGPRLAAFDALAGAGGPGLPDLVQELRTSQLESLRVRAAQAQGALPPEQALELYRQDLRSDSPRLQRAALEGVARIQDPEATRLLSRWMDRLAGGEVPDGLILDLLEAVQVHGDAALLDRLESYREKQAGGKDPLAAWRETLHGGDALAGRELFETRLDLQCSQCHLSGPSPGVGPDLAAVGRRLSRERILESLLFPNHEITPGYESVSVALSRGGVLQGVVREESGEELVIASLEDGVTRIPLGDILARRTLLSPMPEGLADRVTRRELRDLVEYLSTLR